MSFVHFASIWEHGMKKIWTPPVVWKNKPIRPALIAWLGLLLLGLLNGAGSFVPPPPPGSSQGLALYLEGLTLDQIKSRSEICLLVKVNGLVTALIGDVAKGPARFEVKEGTIYSAVLPAGLVVSPRSRLEMKDEYLWRQYLLLFDPTLTEVNLEIIAARLPPTGLSFGGSFGVAGFENLRLDSSLIVGRFQKTFSVNGDSQGDTEWLAGTGMTAKFRLVSGAQVRMPPASYLGISGQAEWLDELFVNPAGAKPEHATYKTWPPWDTFQTDETTYHWEHLDWLGDLARRGYSVLLVSRLAGSKGEILNIKLPDWVLNSYLGGAVTSADLNGVAQANIDAAVKAYGRFFYQLVIECAKRRIALISPVNEPNHPAQDGWPGDHSKIHPMVHALVAEALIQGQAAQNWLTQQGMFVPKVGLNLNGDSSGDPRVRAGLQNYPEFLRDLSKYVNGREWAKQTIFLNTYPGTWTHWPYYKGEHIIRIDPVWAADQAYATVRPIKTEFDTRFGTDVDFMISEVGWSTPDLAYSLQKRFVERLFARTAENMRYDPHLLGFVYFHLNDEGDPLFGWVQDGAYSLYNKIWAMETHFGLKNITAQLKDAFPAFQNLLQKYLPTY
jgi:hypothetical protein